MLGPRFPFMPIAQLDSKMCICDVLYGMLQTARWRLDQSPPPSRRRLEAGALQPSELGPLTGLITATTRNFGNVNLQTIFGQRATVYVVR